MSGGVVRTSNTRRHARNNNASPYSRPSAKKSSGWSLTGLLNYINPFSSPPEEERAAPEGDAAMRLAARGQELQVDTLSLPTPPHQPPPHPQPPQTTFQSPPQATNGEQRTSPRSDDSQESSSANLKKVQQFLDEKAGRPLNHVELAGLVHLLQNSVEEEDYHPEPFRFSKSPSTPLRGTTPINFLSPSTSDAGTSTQGARKTLAKNPMGVYRWQGGGSARPRNRYQSPSFGSTPSRSTMKLVPEKPKNDGKRRRVGEDAATSSPQRTSAFIVTKVNGPATSTLSSSVSAPASLNGTSSTNGTTAHGRPNNSTARAPPVTPRVRTSAIKFTAPANPSPLRQTWGHTDSPPHTSSPPASKPTRAASFMTELIKEVTPPKKPDLVNPYEAANPMIKPAPKKQPVRRTRAATRAEAQAPKKDPELTPQAIIEATVPKGSKRSRPPPELIGVKPSDKSVTSPPAQRRSTRLNGSESATNGINGSSKRSVTVEEVSDDEQPSPPKKQRTVKSPPVAPAKQNPVIVEEVEDVEMTSTPSSRSAPAPTVTLPSEVVEPSNDKTEKKRSTSPTPTFAGFGGSRTGLGAGKSSAPKAPSKLRYSIQVDKDEKMDSTPTLPPTSSILASSIVVSPPPKLDVGKPKDARAFVAAMRADELPKYSFALPSSSPGAGPSTPKARQAVTAAPVSSLPSYDFSKSGTPAPASASKPSTGFDWTAAGPPKPSGDAWSCSMCKNSNPSHLSKCKDCEEPKPNPKPAATQGFDWAAAGLKPPPTDGWSCSLCGVHNEDNATQCPSCETQR